MPPEIFAAISGCSSRSCHCSVAVDGRIVSDTSTSRPSGAGVPKISTSRRLMPNRSSNPCIANCGWFEAGGVVNLPCASLDAADGLPGRRRRDRYRAPAAPPRLASDWRRRAGILRSPASSRSNLPRSPAPRDARSGARLRRRSEGRAAPPVRSVRFPARCSGQALRAMRKNSSECCQYWSSWSGTSLSSASQSTPRVTMSSISRARSPASASVDAGPPTTSGAETGRLGPRRDQMRQRQPAFEFAEPRRNVERRDAAELFGAFRERQFVLVDIAERHDARQDRRIGLHLVEKDFPRQPPGAPGRQIERRLRQVHGLLRASNPSTSRPSTSAAMTVRRSGTETGTLKTRMGCLIRGQGNIGSDCGMVMGGLD